MNDRDVHGGNVASGPAAHGLPWRSDGPDPPPAGIGLPAPGESPWLQTSMRERRRLRPLKRWRYVGVYGERAMICAGDVHIGPARQTFWAVWDRQRQRLLERTHLVVHRGVRLEPGRVHVSDAGAEIEIRLDERGGVRSVCEHGRDGYVWTRKQGGITARARVTLPGEDVFELTARAVVDDTAGYHDRHTEWIWSAGVGAGCDGTPVAWNLVTGVNDPDRNSERTIWIGDSSSEPQTVRFAPDLSGVAFAEGGGLSFAPESTRRRSDRLLLVRSEYEQPFGTFAGTLPGGVELACGFGVMERHAARW